LNGFVPNRAFETTVARATARRHQTLIEDLVRAREDAGISRTSLAAAAGVARRYLDEIEAGEARPSIEMYQRLAIALGADLSTRIYPNTGPAIRDRHQARIAELALTIAHRRWDRFGEVKVWRPSRGWIDLVFHDPMEHVVIATEIQSELRRLEQLVRWSAEKAEGLPSWDGWGQLGDDPAISRLLLVRRTRGTVAVAREFERQLRLAYPAHPDDALASLTGTAPWPGPAMVWVVLDGARTRFVPGR
jgi:transcriptional regulator with XRE-family HTH domain